MSSKRCCAKTCFNAQLTNKTVSFFGFPKSEFYAHQWAKAAGRKDLLHKPLQALSKYCLCSEHFTEDCFANPPLNTILKKHLRPVKAPIPTIFENNLKKFMTKSSQLIEDCSNVDMDTFDRNEEQTAIKFFDPEDEPTTVLVVPEDLITQEKYKDCVMPDFSSESDSEIKGNLDSQHFLYTVESVKDDENEVVCESKGVCRLCASEFDSDNLMEIFSTTKIYEVVNCILPGEIKQDDGYSQVICGSCFENGRHCANIIKGFREAQELLQLTC